MRLRRVSANSAKKARKRLDFFGDLWYSNRAEPREIDEISSRHLVEKLRLASGEIGREFGKPVSGLKMAT